MRTRETALGMDTTITLMAMGINPARAESELEVLPPEIWQQALITAGWKRSKVISSDAKDLAAAVKTLDAGQPAWLWLIASALLFLLLEMVLLKRKSAKPAAVVDP